MTAKQKLQKRIDDETSINQTQAGAILGIPGERVKDVVNPSHYLFGPKYNINEVVAYKKKLAKRTQDIKDSQRDLLQR